ncbi:MAG TPA: hypothetical protein VLC52_02345, partial [Anaerolineae bacterium]|nr:hypothetical protein [Anaerolineae bacterium]
MSWQRRLFRGFACFLLVATVLLLALPPGARGQGQQGLLVPTAEKGSIDRGDEPAIVRSRFVDVDLALSTLQAAPAEGEQRLTLNLFDDLTL